MASCFGSPVLSCVDCEAVCADLVGGVTIGGDAVGAHLCAAHNERFPRRCMIAKTIVRA